MLHAKPNGKLGFTLSQPGLDARDSKIVGKQSTNAYLGLGLIKVHFGLSDLN